MNALRPTPVSTNAVIFTTLARRVQRRLLTREFFHALRALGWLPWLGAASAVALGLLGAGHLAWSAALAGVLLWLLAAAGRAWARRPSAYAALAHWDVATDRKELFSNALIFASQEELDAGRELHLIRARIELDEIISRLPRELPLPRLAWGLALGPLAATGLAFAPWQQWTAPLEEQPLSAEQLAAAQAEIKALAEAADSLPDTAREALSDEERRLLEELKKQQQELAAELQKTDGPTPQELLDALEQQAKAAEELAQQLGAGKQAWASSEMLAEMKKHVDLAELAEALEDKKAARSAEEARELGDKLKNPELSQEATERLKTAYARTMAHATESDRTQLAGQHLAQADTALQQDHPAHAGDIMHTLADKFQRQQERELAQAELEKLAEQLRQMGQNLLTPTDEMLQKLASSGASASAETPMGDLMPLSEMAFEAGDLSTLPLSDLMPQAGTPRGTPIPGTAPPAGSKPLAVAVPIPGTAGNAAVPIPGAGAGAPTGQPGGTGLMPGRGAAQLNGKATDPAAAAAQAEVTVTAGEGESFVQTVQGKPRQEGAQRAAQRTAAAFVRMQESALDEQNLPPARRQQVKRYFDSLRQRFGE